MSFINEEAQAVADQGTVVDPQAAQNGAEQPSPGNIEANPSIGRTVHYVDESGDHFPAVVVRVWNAFCLNLVVFTDRHGQEVAVRTSVTRATDINQPQSWHWPERV